MTRPSEVPVPSGEDARPGYQADGSYVPCPDCHHVPAPDTGIMPRTPGTTIHNGDCPKVSLSPDVAAKLQADLAEMDRVRRRGAAEAAFYVIG